MGAPKIGVKVFCSSNSGKVPFPRAEVLTVNKRFLLKPTGNVTEQRHNSKTTFRSFTVVDSLKSLCWC